MEYGVIAFLFVFWLLLSVKVLNEYERGVVFRLGKLLPVPKGPGLVVVAFPIDRMVRVSLRTVVLEDELPARKYLVDLIESTRLAEVVGAVASIGEAREVLAARPVDVVFVDVELAGGVNGLELIQSLNRTDDGPVRGRMPRAVQRPVFVLATAFGRHAMKAFELGVVDYLLKPLSAERVEQCLRRLVGLLAPDGP